jgi:hypothetical protein
VKNTVKLIHFRSTHKVNGSSHLLPSQVRQLGAHCVSGNNLCDFSIFVLFLVAINLFLRKLEFSSLDEANLHQNMFVMTGEYIVRALHLSVLGKGVRNTTRGESVLTDLFDFLITSVGPCPLICLTTPHSAGCTSTPSTPS